MGSRWPGGRGSRCCYRPPAGVGLAGRSIRGTAAPRGRRGRGVLQRPGPPRPPRRFPLPRTSPDRNVCILPEASSRSSVADPPPLRPRVRPARHPERAAPAPPSRAAPDGVGRLCPHQPRETRCTPPSERAPRSSVLRPPARTARSGNGGRFIHHAAATSRRPVQHRSSPRGPWPPTRATRAPIPSRPRAARRSRGGKGT